MRYKKGRLYLCGPKDKNVIPNNAVIVYTVSRSCDFGKAFSPFLNQGPIELGELVSKNVENLWQYTKVYKQHVDNPNEWIKWRDNGLKDSFANRYPMGKGSKPEFSYFNNKKLGYIDARKEIYIPAFWQKLDRYCQSQINTLMDMLTVTDVWLWDFDGRHNNQSWEDNVNDEQESLGHAFVIKKYVYDRIGRDWND